MANIPFTAFAFAASGGTTARTMPTRLAEVKNVKDFGAVGNGSTDDTAAIQAAINWTSGADRGVIYFPPTTGGIYRMDSGVTLNYDGPLSIIFRGSGSSARLAGSGSGFLFTRTLGTASNTADIVFENILATNTHNTGGIARIGSAKKVAFRDCNFTAHFIYTAENTDGGLASTNAMFSSCILAAGGTVVGSIGVIMAGGVVEGTDLRNFDVGYRIAGSGTTFWGSKCERCNTAMEFGVGNASQARASATDIGAQGVAIVGGTFEGHHITFHFAGTTEGFFASGVYILGHDSNSGAVEASGGTQIGIWIPPDKLKAALFQSIDVGNHHEVAGVKLDDPTERPFITFMNCGGTISSTGVNWLVSSKAMAARYVNCTRIAPVYTFANLPDSTYRREGDEFDISDCNTTTWGATAASGGANHVRVRFNGTNWTVVGI